MAREQSRRQDCQQPTQTSHSAGDELLLNDQTIGGIVSKETVCCVGGKVKH